MAAGAGQAGQDGPCSNSARVADEQRVLPIENHAFHLSFAHIVVEGHCAARGEYIEFPPLAQGVADSLGQGVARQ